MFGEAISFNRDISKWDVSKVITMKESKSKYVYSRITRSEHAIVIGGFSRGSGWWRGCGACVRVSGDKGLMK